MFYIKSKVLALPIQCDFCRAKVTFANLVGVLPVLCEVCHIGVISANLVWILLFWHEQGLEIGGKTSFMAFKQGIPPNIWKQKQCKKKKNKHYLICF